MSSPIFSRPGGARAVYDAYIEVVSDLTRALTFISRASECPDDNIRERIKMAFKEVYDIREDVAKKEDELYCLSKNNQGPES